MKKLLLAVAALTIGFAANAASYAWGLCSYDYLGPNGEGDDGAGGHYYAGGTAFLYLGTVTYDNGFNTDSATLITSGAWDDTYYGYGALSVDDASSLPQSSAISTASGQAYSIVLVDAAVDSITDDSIQNYIIVTGTSTSDYDPGTEITYAGFVDYTTVIGGDGVAWTATSSAPPEPIPEPTSGLLVLLGVAGLALKRKKA